MLEDAWTVRAQISTDAPYSESADSAAMLDPDYTLLRLCCYLEPIMASVFWILSIVTGEWCVDASSEQY